jgi:type II secretory pathway predicted ATPase ExeA
MYAAHFGFTQAPFERELPTALLYDSPCFSEALARLLYVCKKRTLALITGEAGSGKSALLRLLGSKLDPNAYLYSYIADSSLTPPQFLFSRFGGHGPFPFGASGQTKKSF